MQNANCKRRRRIRAFRRRGGIYIAVLGTSLIVALLGMTALIGQRIQNRIIKNSADVRQAELNAGSAVELALLTMKQNTNWRTTQPHGRWFTARATGAGTCSLDVTDPIDWSLSNNPDDVVLLRGIGYSGQAEQCVEVTVDPRRAPLSSLRSALAAGDTVDLQGSTLRTAGVLTGNQFTASSSQVYGDVQAVAISGSSYNGTSTQILASKMPIMPDWTSVSNHYKTNGTALDITKFLTTPPTLARNGGIENGTTAWVGNATGSGMCDIDKSNNQVRSGSNALRVRNRSLWISGPSQGIEGFVEPNKQYVVDAYVYLPELSTAKNFQITLYTKGSGGAAQVDAGPDTNAVASSWQQLTATVTAPSWSGNLEYAFVKIAGADSNNTADFYLDDFSIREALTGKLVYRHVLGPGVNTLYSGAPVNPQGLYWVDCAGNRLTITRSRIVGTLLVINPGAGSCIGQGPMSWEPATPGYPALLVDADNATDADFGINATNRALSEAENAVNFNPAGAPHEEFGLDADMNDIYRSAIRGLIAVRDDLTFAYRPLVRGQVLVGDDLVNTGGQLEIEYLPEALLNPPPGFYSYRYDIRPTSVRKVVSP